MHKERLVLLFDIEWFERVHLFKDVGMIPAYFSKLYDFDSTIVFYEHEKNHALKQKECDINLIRIKKNGANKVKWLRNFVSPMSLYLIRNAKNIDVLMLFHLKKENYYYRFLYKIFNPKGKVYLKLDKDETGVKGLEKYKKEEQKSLNVFNYKDGFVAYLKTIKRKISLKRIQNELSKFELISVETKNAYDRLRKVFGNKVSENFILIPNGFPDENESLEYVKDFKDKENIIITVGRIGTEQKNNEMLLKAAERLRFNDWKIYFIGPIEKHFEKYIHDFYNHNPELKDKVIFTGNVNEKSKLYEWYARSKVFCLTSRYEGFPLVFPEAIYFGDYIVSTKVGADEDITKGGVLGKRINQDDIDSLAKTLQDIIDNKIDIGKKYDEVVNFSRENFVWDKILEKIYYKLYLNENSPHTNVQKKQ
ncbi:glycosyltransferase family 4 protein [Bacillus sp. FJAT-29814]|uniref:glycosyltransferase family 4 protein n=1 Tax=Bacillus sp. FJAT-29814 TaxID=1729688 RepID=UPI00082ABE31|nr:glycosyltransferase family 4 protein [Bacillus sp. FJAT-29814]